MATVVWLALALALVGAPMAIYAAKKGAVAQSEDTPLRKKARHYFLSGMIADAENRKDEAYELFKKAWSIDTTYYEAAYYFGISRLHNDLDTMRTRQGVQESINMVRRFADAHQDDSQENLYYAYISGLVDPEESARAYARVVEKNPTRTPLLLQLAEAQIRARKLPEALESLNKYESIEGPNADVSTRKIQLMFSQADTVAAMNEANRLIDQYPTNTRFRMLRASLAGIVGDTIRMEQDLTEADRLDPEDANIKFALADLYLSKGDSVKYDNYYFQALVSPGLELEDKRDMLGQYLHRLLTDKGSTSRGDKLFSELGKQYAHEPVLLELEARYRMATGNMPQAIELMEYATSLDPDNETYWQQLMTFAMMDKQYKQVEKFYSEATDKFLPGPDIKMLYAAACSLAGDYAKALAAYGEIAEPILNTSDLTAPLSEMNPLPKIGLSDADLLMQVYLGASDVLWKDKKAEETFAVCRNALFLSPDDALTLNNYAYFLAETDRDLEQAREMAQRAIELEPENPTYLDTFAWVLYKAGDYADALEYQRKAMSAAEGEDREASAELYEHLALILKANGQSKEAKEAEAKARHLKEEESK